MPVTRAKLLFFAATAVLMCGERVTAQYWVPGTAPMTNWWAMACSSDANTIIAACGWPSRTGGPLYISTNSGLTWNPTSAPLTNWAALACSADARTIVAAAGWYYYSGFPYGNVGPVYVSPDSGITWVQTSLPVAGWFTVASSADGTRLAAGSLDPAGGAYIWTSTNSGASWNPAPAPLTNNACTSLALSADGTKLAAVEASSYVYTSHDFGLTWSVSSPTVGNWDWITSSADGARLAVGAGWSSAVPGNYNPVYTSADYGVTWAPSSSPAKVVLGIASSADGNVLLAMVGGHLLVSNDRGSTWTDSVSPRGFWGAVASSADGSKLLAAANANGTIYTLQSAPRLDIAPSGTSVVLSWPAYATGLGIGQYPDPTTNFVVQYSAQGGGGTWSDLTVLPIVTNLTDTLTLSPGAGTGFYRLKRSF